MKGIKLLYKGDSKINMTMEIKAKISRRGYVQWCAVTRRS